MSAPVEQLLPEGRALLGPAGIGSYAALWALELPQVEPGNRGRGGVSEVSRLELPGAVVYLKRQRGHCARSLTAPLRGRPTLERELAMLRRAARAGVGTPTVLYFAAWRRDAAALLVTLALEGYAVPDPGLPTPARRGIIAAVAGTVRRLHRARIQHGCLYPKHVLVRAEASGCAVRLLDFEKARWRWWRARAAARDLDSLNRHAAGYSRTDRLRFLLAYRGERRLSRAGRRQWRSLARRAVAAP